MTSSRLDRAALLALVILVSFLLFFVLRLPLTRLEIPYSFAGDTIDKLTYIKTVAENGWLFYNERLGYPFGYDRLDFPRFDSLNYAIMGPIAALTGEAGLAMNLYYIAGFYLIALSAFYCLRRLGLDIGPALISALIFAFLPYHLNRGVAHLTNGTYFLIPFAILVLIRLAQDQIGIQTHAMRRRWLLALAVSVLLPLQTPYNGVFFAFLCFVAGAIALAHAWRWRKVFVTFSLLVALGGTFMIEQIPRLMHQAENGQVAAGHRSPFDAQMYSMQLHQVLLPTTQHRLGIFREQAGRFNEIMQVPRSEVRHQYIGVLGLLGLGVLLWTLFRKHNRPAAQEESAGLESSVRIAALLALVIILIAISTGLGTLIANFVTPSIRAYNRMLPFLAFAALIGGGWLLHLMVRRIDNSWLRAAAMVIIGAILLFDIVPQGTSTAARNATVAEYDRTHDYFGKVEERLGQGATLFQVPVTWYPEHPPINRMLDYDNLKPFLLTDTLRFSAGMSRHRDGYKWSKMVERQPAEEIVAHTHAAGFAAILVDGFGYGSDELQQLTDGLTRVLPEPPQVSEDGRWWTFSLNECCGAAKVQLKPGEVPDVLAYTVGGPSIRFTSEGSGSLYAMRGWNNPEPWGTWADTEAHLRFNLASAGDEALLLSLDTRMMLGPNLQERTLKIECNGQPCGEFVYTLSQPVQQLQITLPPGLVAEGGRLDLHLTTSPPATPRMAGVNEDGRSLGFGLTSLSISRAERAAP